MTIADEEAVNGALPVEFERLRVQLRDIAIEPSLQGEHTENDAILYHFTIEAGLRGILETGTLWATLLGCLEDEGETRYPVDFCLEYLADRQAKETGDRGRFLLALINTMQSFPEFIHCLEKQAASSLSKRNNLSSQWNEYAESGRGYALGFGSHELLTGFTSRLEDADSTSKPNSVLLRMVYEPTKQRRILNELLDAVFDSVYFPNPGSTQMERSLTASTAYFFGVAAASFKRPCYSAENEVRVTVPNHRELSIAGTPLPIESRVRDKHIIEYVSVDVRDSKMELPLKEILIGPNLEAEASRKLVRSLIDATKNVDGQTVTIRKVSADELE